MVPWSTFQSSRFYFWDHMSPKASSYGVSVWKKVGSYCGGCWWHSQTKSHVTGAAGLVSIPQGPRRQLRGGYQKIRRLSRPRLSVLGRPKNLGCEITCTNSVWKSLGDNVQVGLSVSARNTIRKMLAARALSCPLVWRRLNQCRWSYAYIEPRSNTPETASFCLIGSCKRHTFHTIRLFE